MPVNTISPVDPNSQQTPQTTQDHPVWNSIRAIGHGIGWLIPGVQEAQAMEASTNAHRQQALRNKIDEYRTRELAAPQPDDPNWHQRVDLLNRISGEVQQMGPFDNPKKHAQRLFDEYESLHPAAYNAPTAPPQVTATPGVKPPGGVPGTPNLSVTQPGGQPAVPSIEQATGGVVSRMPSAPPAATPGSSPVQPARQGGGEAVAPSPFPSIPEPPQIAGIGGQGDQGSTPTFQSVGTGLSPEPPSLVLPPRPTYQLPPPSLERDTYPELATAMRESQSPYVQAQAGVEQALNQLRGTTEFQMAEAPRRLEMLKSMIGQDNWTGMDPVLKGYVASETMGINLPGLTNALFGQTQREPVDVSQLSAEERAAYGIPASATGTWVLLKDRLQRVVGALPAGAALQVQQTNQGPVVVNKNNPEQAAKPLVQPNGQPISPTNNFGAYYQNYLRDNKLQNTAFNMRKAWAEWNASSQKPPQAIAITPDNRAIAVRPGTVVPSGTMGVSQYGSQFTPTPQSKRASELASDLSNDIEPRVRAAIDVAEQKLGPGSGRWNNWWVKKGGFNDPEYTFLDQALDLYASAIVNVHFGGRGGQAYRDALRKDFSEAQSADDLRARMAGADIFLDAYAKGSSSRNVSPQKPGPVRPAGGTAPIQPIGGVGQAAPKPGDVVGGYQFKGGDPHKQYNWAPAPGGR